MTELLPHFKRDIESVELIPSDGGRFEVEYNGELVYSKLKTKAFPDSAALIQTLESKIGA